MDSQIYFILSSHSGLKNEEPGGTTKKTVAVPQGWQIGGRAAQCHRHCAALIFYVPHLNTKRLIVVFDALGCVEEGGKSAYACPEALDRADTLVERERASDPRFGQREIIPLTIPSPG